MKSSNLEIDTMSEVNLPSYINTIDYSNRKYSKDDIDIEKGLIDSEVCQICFNIIWDHMCLVCPNEQCDSSTDRAICSECSEKIYERARKDIADFVCPFCRTIIIDKNNFQRELIDFQNLVIVNDDLDDEDMVILFNPRERQRRVIFSILGLFAFILLIYIVYNLIVVSY